MKTSNLSSDNFKKILNLNGPTPEPTIWSIDHNIDVQYVCNISFPMLPIELESKKLNIGFPVVRTDARCTVTWLPNFLGCVDLLTHGALLARFTRGALL